jgi:protein-L-isoaspartate(D-aspartate) O-methyltransferase
MKARKLESGTSIAGRRRRSAVATVALLVACAVGVTLAQPDRDPNRSEERRRMVERQIEARGVGDPRVIDAMRAVPRHRFVPERLQDQAYADTPLPIGLEQTISQPYIVAYMTEALQLSPTATVLEVGTGSGYQAAVLAEVARQVYSIEIVPELADRSANVLTALGYSNIELRQGDGYRGWPEAAPFDGIIVTAAPDHIPPALIDQLAVGGRLVIPVGSLAQEMRVITKTEDGPISETTIPVRFVPMTGEAREQRER